MVRCLSKAIVVVLIASLMAVSQALGQTTLTLADVQARIKEARGHRPKSERIESTYMRHGLPGSDVMIRSGANVRTDSKFGPFTTAYGVFDGASWSQNENGETVLDSGGGNGTDGDAGDVEPGDEMTITQLSQPPDAHGEYVISELTKLGFGTKDYIDPSTWHIVRRDRITPTETRVTTYEDYRTTDGYSQAWHTSTTDGHSENDTSRTIEKIETDPIPETSLAVPPNARKLVEFPAGASSVVLPLRYDSDAGKFIVRVTIDGRGLDFMLDTGSSGIIINRNLVHDLGFKEYDPYSNSANAGRYVGTRTIVPAVSIGPLTMHDVEMDTIPDLGFGGADTKIVGLLGFDFIDSIGLKLDYQHGSATAYDLAAFSVPAAPRMIDLDVRLGSHVPETDVTINGALGSHWILDTGGAGAALITDYFRRRYPDAVVDEDRVDRLSKLSGVGGDIDARYIKLASFKLGAVTFKHFGAYAITDAKAYAGGDDGVIGPDLFRLFTVYIDYAEQHVRMIPNDAGSFGITK